MYHRLRTFALVCVGATTLACASSGSTPKPQIRPPELLTRDTRPDLVAARIIPNSPRPTTLVDIQFNVNPDGRPDISTLKITGVAAGENRAAVTTWVQGLSFRPATQDGIPVVGTYRTSFSAMVRTQVVR